MLHTFQHFKTYTESLLLKLLTELVKFIVLFTLCTWYIPPFQLFHLAQKGPKIPV